MQCKVLSTDTIQQCRGGVLYIFPWKKCALFVNSCLSLIMGIMSPRDCSVILLLIVTLHVCVCKCLVYGVYIVYMLTFIYCRTIGRWAVIRGGAIILEADNRNDGLLG